MERRQFLKAVGTAGAAGLAGCINRGSATAEIGDAFTTRGASIVVNEYSTEQTNPRVTLSLVNATTEPLDLEALFESAALSLGRRSVEENRLVGQTQSTELVPGELVRSTLAFDVASAAASEQPATLTIGDAAVLLADADGAIDPSPTATLTYTPSIGQQSFEQDGITYEITFSSVGTYNETGIVIPSTSLTVTNNNDEPVTFDKDDVIHKDNNGNERLLESQGRLTNEPIEPDESRDIFLQQASFSFETQFIAVDRDAALGTKQLLRV